MNRLIPQLPKLIFVTCIRWILLWFFFSIYLIIQCSLALWLFWNTLFHLNCLMRFSNHLSFSVLANIHCFVSLITTLKPLVLIQYFSFGSSFLFLLQYFHLPLNQSSIWLKSFWILTISPSICLFQNSSLLPFLLTVTPSLSYISLALAHTRSLISS